MTHPSRSSRLHTVLLALLTLALPATSMAQNVPAAPAAGGPLTFDEALARLHRSHEMLAAADAEIRQRREEREAARGLYYPRVDLRAQATHLNDEIVIDLDPIRQVINTLHRLPDSALPPFASTAQTQDFWLSQVTLTWPLYTGGKVQAANRAAALQITDAEQRKTLVATALSTDLVRRYFGLRLATRALEVKRAAATSLGRHLFEAKRLEEEGLIARAERLHAEVAETRARRDVSAAEHDAAMARTALASVLSTDEDVEPTTELFLVSDLGSLDTLVAGALGHHPALARLDTQRALADTALRAERGRRLPDVAVFGTRELHAADLSLLNPKWAVGLSASVTLFDGFDRRHRIAAARSQQDRVAALDSRARRDIATLVEQKLRAATKAREQYTSLDTTLALATEVVRARSLAFDEGLGTSLDVVDAQLTLQAVQLQRLLAAYEFDVALAELCEAGGEPARFSDLRQRADLFPER